MELALIENLQRQGPGNPIRRSRRSYERLMKQFGRLTQEQVAKRVVKSPFGSGGTHCVCWLCRPRCGRWSARRNLRRSRAGSQHPQ